MKNIDEITIEWFEKDLTTIKSNQFRLLTGGSVAMTRSPSPEQWRQQPQSFCRLITERRQRRQRRQCTARCCKFAQHNSSTAPTIPTRNLSASFFFFGFGFTPKKKTSSLQEKSMANIINAIDSVHWVFMTVLALFTSVFVSSDTTLIINL